MNKTLAIVGRAKETREFAPYDNLDVDIWAFNDYGYRSAKRVTAIFETHPDCLEAQRYESDYKEWLKQQHGFPIYMYSYDERVPSGVSYPFDEIRKQFGGHLWAGDKAVEDYYTSTTPYALALALLYGYQRIELYGIELYDNGYRKQGDCIFYWLGQANARRVDVVIHERSKLYSNTKYPIGF